MKAMTISKAARAAGVSIETVRFYERRHLIVRPSKPPNGGFRRYPPETVERVRFIRQAQGLGFSLREIEELLSLRADPATDCGQVRERVVLKLEDVERRIGGLERFRRALKGLIAACPGSGALRACSIMEALGGAQRECALAPARATDDRRWHERRDPRDPGHALRPLRGLDHKAARALAPGCVRRTCRSPWAVPGFATTSKSSGSSGWSS